MIFELGVRNMKFRIWNYESWLTLPLLKPCLSSLMRLWRMFCSELTVYQIQLPSIVGMEMEARASCGSLRRRTSASVYYGCLAPWAWNWANLPGYPRFSDSPYIGSVLQLDWKGLRFSLKKYPPVSLLKGARSCQLCSRIISAKLGCHKRGVCQLPPVQIFTLLSSVCYEKMPK